MDLDYARFPMAVSLIFSFSKALSFSHQDTKPQRKKISGEEVCGIFADEVKVTLNGEL